MPRTSVAAIPHFHAKNSGVDGAVGACGRRGGVMAWGRLCVGLPSLIIAIEQNQVETATNLDRLGLAHYLGPSDTVSERSLAEAFEQLMADAARLNAVRRRARAMVDGLGVDRVVATLLSDGSL
jgi:UDP-2,4-diacetamido-2,4,6-trideoxy-beta-L-altropyranose hydrolase